MISKMKTMRQLLDEQAHHFSLILCDSEPGIKEGVIVVANKVLKHPLAVPLAALITDRLRWAVDSAPPEDRDIARKYLADFLHCLVEFRDHDISVTMTE